MSPATQTTEAAPRSESTELRLGGWAGVVGGNRRFIGRVGKIVAIDSNYVVLKWKGSRGKRYFRHIHVVPAATEDPSGTLFSRAPYLTEDAQASFTGFRTATSSNAYGGATND